MCEDAEVFRLHLAQGQRQQDPHLHPQQRENKEALQPPGHLEDARVRDRLGTRNRKRGQNKICRVLRPIRKFIESRSQHEQRVQCESGRSLLLRLPHIQHGARVCNRHPISRLVCVE